MDDLVVQIVSYHSKQYLSACLDSIIEGLKDSDISYKILILENHSGENLSNLEEKYKNASVSFYYSDKNLGFGGGHNFLAKKADSKYIFALNPDTVVSKYSIKTLFEFMEEYPRVGLCGPRVEEPIGFFWHKSVFWPKLFTLKSFCEKYLHIHIFRNKIAIEFNPILGCAMFFRRKAFEEIDGFDEKFFLYFEEGDICNRLKIKMWKTFFVYNALVTHFYTRSDIRPQNAKINKESEEYFYKKWPQGDIK